MKPTPLLQGSRGIDSEPWSHNADLSHAQALRAAGVEFVSLYLGAVSTESLANVIAAGLAFVPVTYASAIEGATPGATAVSALRSLAVPPGVTVFLDVEGPSSLTDPAGLIAKINAWGDAVAAAGYIPGIYVGSPQPFTSADLSALRVFRYWRGQGSIRDRNGALAEPSSGWCAWQAWPSLSFAGVWSDVDATTNDYKGRCVVACGP